MSRLFVPAFAALLALLAAAPASALESLEDARCTCADSAVNQGDYVSCLTKMTRRLVLLGAIDRVERSNAIADASTDDLDAILAECGGDAGLDVSGWGVGLQVGTAFYPAPAPSGVASAAEVSLFLWNLSPQDVDQTTSGPAVDECLFEVTILDQVGNIVRRDDSVCLPIVDEFDLPMGTVERRDFVLPLLAFDSETGLGDGARLPEGGYSIRVTWRAFGPNRDDMPSTAGTRPTASISIRVGS